MKIKASKNKGITLIEALIWMAISGAVIVSAFVLYSNFRQQQKADQVISELDFLYKNITRIIHKSQVDEVVAILKLKDMGAIPETIKITNETIPGKNAFGGNVPVGIQINSSSNGPVGLLTATYTLIPTGEICNKIVYAAISQGWTTVFSKGYGQIVTGSSVKLNNISICDPDKAKTVQLVFRAENLYVPADLNTEN